jgi:hypothetical protein
MRATWRRGNASTEVLGQCKLEAPATDFAVGKDRGHALIHVSDDPAVSCEVPTLHRAGVIDMPIKPRAPAAHDLPTSALLPFLAITFLIAWGLIGVYILAPETAAATFGGISGTHPFFFLATWSPAIAAFLVVAYHGGASGIRAFLSRLLLWRCPTRLGGRSS